MRLGFNYRLSDLQAALGVAPARAARRDPGAARDRAAARYGELLAGIDGVEAPHPDDAEHVRSWFVYVVKLDRGLDRDCISASLGARGVEAGHYVPCVHLQPYLRERYGFREGMCPVAEDAAIAHARAAVLHRDIDRATTRQSASLEPCVLRE